MEPLTKVYLLDADGQRFSGDGPCRLLKLVEETGSLHSAAQKMGMAYTKAMKLLRQTEAAGGAPVTVRRVGGKAGGGSTLTPRGKELVRLYERYKERCIQANRQIYLEIFGGDR